MKNSALPVQPAERLLLLDVLRGFAIFGILMVNMKIFSNPMTIMMLPLHEISVGESLIPDYFVRFFFEGKFYTLFSLLFGYGFWIFMNKQVESGSILPVFKRRLLILLLTGALHLSLVWAGDILFFYALLGFLLILFRKSSNRKIAIWGVIMVFFPTILMLIMWGFIALGSMAPEGKAAIDASFQESADTMRALVENAYQVYSTGSYSEVTSIRIKEWLTLLPGMFFFYPSVLGMFLFGTWAARKGLGKADAASSRFFKKVLPWSLVLGIAGEGLYTWLSQSINMSVPTGTSLLATFSHALGAPAMTLFYVSSIALLLNKDIMRSFWNALVPVGRMALTNYLMQSIICTLIFYSYGLGYFGKFTTLDGIILVVVIFTIQIFASRLWFRKYSIGPAEWLWRSLTYMKKQQMVKKG